MNTQFYVIVLALIIGSCGCKKENPKEVLTDNPLISVTDKAIDEVVRPYANKKEIIGFSIGLLQNNKQLFYNYGEKSKAGNQLPDRTTAFEIGSISKTFTALMLTQWLQKSLLSLDTKVNDLLPKDIPPLQYNGKYILVKHLLNHTSALPRLPDDFETGMNAAQPYTHYDSLKIYKYLKTYSLQKEPGMVFNYSNLGMGLAGLILERLSGKSYADYLRDNITSPLSLKNTTANFAQAANLASPHDAKGRTVDFWNNLAGFKGAGAIYSCTSDLLAYAESVINPEKTTINVPFNTVQQPTFNDGSYKLGLGWFFITINGLECLVHDGGTGGFRSFIYINKSAHIALVVLSNNGTDDIANMAKAIAEKIIK